MTKIKLNFIMKKMYKGMGRILHFSKIELYAHVSTFLEAFASRVNIWHKKNWQFDCNLLVDDLGPSDAMWRSGSSLSQVMACCLTAPNHYLNQCWLIISKIEWHSYEGKFIRDTSAINHWNYPENQLPKISFKFLRGQWVNSVSCDTWQVTLERDNPPIDLDVPAWCYTHTHGPVVSLSYLGCPLT